MKKLEGIITVTGILLIIGLPMFLLFAGTDTSKINADSERLISINSYSEEKAVVKSIDIDSYEEDFDVLDGSKARGEFEIIDSLTPLAAPVIIESNDVVEETQVIEIVDVEEITSEFIMFEDLNDEIIEENAVPQGIESNEEFTLVENEGLSQVTTNDVEIEELIVLADLNVPEGLEIVEDDSDVVIYEEFIIEFKDEAVSETYEPGSYNPDDELAAYDSHDNGEVEISNEVLPQGLEDGNILSFECSELNDGFGSKVANVSYLDDNGNIITANFAY